jgi:hypothetical protein
MILISDRCLIDIIDIIALTSCHTKLANKSCSQMGVPPEHALKNPTVRARFQDRRKTLSEILDKKLNGTFIGSDKARRQNRNRRDP